MRWRQIKIELKYDKKVQLQAAEEKGNRSELI